MTRVLLGAFLALTLLAAPLAAEAEPRARRRPKIGVVYLSNGPVETWLALPPVKAFLEGMEELHWENDRDFVLDIRPVVDYARVQNVVASFVAGQVDVLLFVTCDTEFHIARRTTHRIPIVIGPCADDLVGKGVVASSRAQFAPAWASAPSADARTASKYAPSCGRKARTRAFSSLRESSLR